MYEDLMRCRLECRTWCNSIKGMSSSAEAIRREVGIQAVRIKSLLNSFSNLSPAVVTTTACLAHYGILRDVENIDDDYSGKKKHVYSMHGGLKSTCRVCGKQFTLTLMIVLWRSYLVM